MKARYIQRGDSIDFVPSTDLNAGEIVHLGNLIGITKIPIKAGTLGTLAVTGVFDVVKPRDLVFASGNNVYWDPQKSCTASSGVFLGIAIQNATAESDHVRILLNSTANSSNEPSSGVDAEWQPL